MTWWETLLVSTIGGLVSLSLKWLFDLGRHQLNIRGQKDVLVHKIQFEKEFNAYAEIWVNIPDITTHMMSYDDITTDKRIERREKELPGLFEKTSKLIADNEPFLHPSVYETCVKYFKEINTFTKLNKKLDNLEVQVNANACENDGDITGSDDKKWNKLHEEWDSSLNKIGQLQREIKEFIRKRIWNTK